MRLDAVVAAIATEIATLSATAYAQVTGDAFREALEPLDTHPELLSAPVAHLSFTVTPGPSLNAGARRDTPGTDGRLTSTVRVYLAYVVRPAYILADQRAHIAACCDIVAAINSEAGALLDGDVVVIPATAYELTSRIVDTGGWTQIAAVTFRIDHAITL